MRVLHVIPSIAARDGGPSKVVLDTCKALRSAGIEAEIATTNADGERNLPIPKEMPSLVDGVPVYFFRRQSRWRYKFSWDLTKWLKHNVANYDLLHLHALFSYSTAAAANYARKRGVPYILLPHGMLGPWPLQKRRLLKKLYLKLVEERNLEDAAAVHFTAEDELLTSAFVGRSRFVLPYVVDLFSETNGNRSPAETRRTRILYLSRLDPKKGVDLLTQALEKLAEEGAEFELVLAGDGDPDYENHVKAMVRNCQLSDKTTFLGFVEGEAKAAVLKSADIFVLPSYDENFGIAVTEAMAAGLPVVVTDRVNIHDEIRKANAGFVVSPAVDSLSAALRRLMDDGGLRVELGQRGRKLVRDKFSLATTTHETVQIYHDVVQQKRLSSAWRT
jgi:glycosyltransferase involved in cell wall biosynthesis